MNIFKKILHLPYIGPMIGFYLGIKGYNRAERTCDSRTEHFRYLIGSGTWFRHSIRA